MFIDGEAIEERLRVLTAQTGLRHTRAWLAERIGVDRAAVHRWVKGIRPCPERRRRDLELVLGMHLEGRESPRGRAA